MYVLLNGFSQHSQFLIVSAEKKITRFKWFNRADNEFVVHLYLNLNNVWLNKSN